MADYYSPTVVNPFLPSDAISLIEILVLTQMYDWEHSGDRLYFFNETGRPSEIELHVAEVRDLIDAAPSDAGRLVKLLTIELSTLEPEQATFTLDVGDHLDAEIFQDILSRCPDVDHITITSAWTCSKMRPDGFGGSVTVITAEKILTESTSSLEDHLLDRALHGEFGASPGSSVGLPTFPNDLLTGGETCSIAQTSPGPAARSLRCPGCGSLDVLCDASVRWDRETGSWSLIDVFDAGWCETCEKDVDTGGASPGRHEGKTTDA